MAGFGSRIGLFAASLSQDFAGALPAAGSGAVDCLHEGPVVSRAIQAEIVFTQHGHVRRRRYSA